MILQSDTKNNQFFKALASETRRLATSAAYRLAYSTLAIVFIHLLAGWLFLVSLACDNSLNHFLDLGDAVLPGAGAGLACRLASSARA